MTARLQLRDKDRSIHVSALEVSHNAMEKEGILVQIAGRSRLNGDPSVLNLNLYCKLATQEDNLQSACRDDVTY
jgi:hypothetical protein